MVELALRGCSAFVHTFLLFHI